MLFLKAEQKVRVGLWWTDQTTRAADSRKDELATASVLIRPDGEESPKDRGPSEAEMDNPEKENEMLNVMREETKERQETQEDRHPERGLVPGGSDGKGLGRDMATEKERFTDEADTWAAGPMGSGSARMSGKEEEIEAEAEGEEGRQPVALKTPVQVTQAERDEHELTHTPFRAWCAHCVRGRGRNMPHLKRRGDEDRDRVPRISFDYFFMSWEDEAAHKNPMLVMKDEATGEKYARAVGQKGLGQGEEMQWLIVDLHEELKSWGHHGGEMGHVIFKKR